jgi:hypothetical protein
VAVAVAAVVFFSCGGPPDDSDPGSCPVPSYEFIGRFTLLESQGNCDLPSISTDMMHFKDGKYAFPLDGVADCHTTQHECTLYVLCQSRLFGARMDFDGTISPNGYDLTGVAKFSGNYKGCSHVTYRVNAYATVTKQP